MLIDSDEPLLNAARRRFHAGLFASSLLSISDKGVPSIADSGSLASKAVAQRLIEQLGGEVRGVRLPGQSAGRGFEDFVRIFLSETFPQLTTVRSGNFSVSGGGLIESYDQYSHLKSIGLAIREDWDLRVALGRDYIIRPDVVVYRSAVEDDVLNARSVIVDDRIGLRSPLRARNATLPTLQASISCKWTMRSDRAQNARSEALNLIRNRKGKLPHIAVVTAEPMASRIASLALGTGDIDCVYHIGLDELRIAIAEKGSEDAQEMLRMMIDGRRLRDIADLPLDLAV